MTERLKIVLGGHLENAMIRRFDEVVTPERNNSMHGYYAALNRKVEKPNQDLADTFLAIAEQTVVPSADWNMPYGDDYGLFQKSDFEIVDTRPKEWQDIQVFAKLICENGALSPRSTKRASALSFEHYPSDKLTHMLENRPEYENGAQLQYVERLLSQVAAAQGGPTRLILPEEDILALQDIIDFVARTSCPTPIDLPDLQSVAVLAAEPVGAIISFSAFDAYNLRAVRLDEQVVRYAREVGRILRRSNFENAEAELTKEMIVAHSQSEAGRKAQSVYEFIGLVLKPLHYVPYISGLLTIPEDIKDVLMLWLNRRTTRKGWYLLGPKMQEISIKEYLNRKGNLIS